MMAPGRSEGKVRVSRANRMNTTGCAGFYTGLLLVVCLLLAPLRAAEVEAVAMVTDLKGRAVIASNAKRKIVGILAYLRPGHELYIEPGASLTLVYFQSGREYLFKGLTRIKVGLKQPLVLDVDSISSGKWSGCSASG